MRLFPNRISKESRQWKIWRWYDIVLDGKLYLSRLNLITTPWFSVKLHWIHRPDPDRHMHSHPWSFVSFVLRGGYEEYESKHPDRLPGRLREIRWFNYKNTITAHRISKVKPHTLTLILSGPKDRQKSWGFYHDQTFEYVNWCDYERLNLSEKWD